MGVRIVEATRTTVRGAKKGAVRAHPFALRGIKRVADSMAHRT